MGFKQLLDKATNPELSDPDWEAILEIVEEIKSKNVALKTVMKEFRRRLLDTNSTVVYYTLLVLDSVMKNCSTEVHMEILSREFMNVIKETITSAKSGGKTVDKALELVGEWKVAFGQQADFKAILDVFFELEREGYHIPETQVASAAFMKKPPDFALHDKCYACRQEFNRFKGHFRHHCRNCGKSVCAQCSGKRAPLPEYGIEEPTRVCDICYKKLDSGASSSGTSSSAPASSSDLPPEYLRSSLAKESQTPAPQSNNAQMQEEDDLQMAIAMSLNEAENKDKQAPKRAPSPSISITTTPSAPPPPASTLYASIVHDPTPTPSQPPPTTYYNGGPPAKTEEESDPNLARYLDRNYWEQRKEQQVPPTSTASAPAQASVGPQPVVVSNGSTVSPLAESVRKTVEMFLARLQEISSVGGNVATDPVILSQYQNLNALQPQLLKQIDDVQQKKAHQQEVLHKLNEAKEARVTLNRMRREHQEKIKQQEQEQALLARMQMEQKLALLRQQKAEQFTFQQALQKQRLDDLQMQRSEYEKQLAQQREAERLQLIAKEQQVLQHQFGQPGMGYGRVDPGPVESVPFQSLSVNPADQAAPLPMKVEYNPNPASEPAPPPYQPPMSTYGQQPVNDGLYQPSPLNSQPLTSQSLSYQQPTTMTSLPPSSVVQPQPQLYGSGPSEMSYAQSSALGPPSLGYQQPHSLPQPHTLTQAQPHTFTQPQSLAQPQSMPSQMGGPQIHPPHPETMQQQQHYQPPPQQFEPAPAPQQFAQPQGGFTGNGGHQQPMGMPNGLAPPRNPEPLLISFD